jgi:hypothetical protein
MHCGPGVHGDGYYRKTKNGQGLYLVLRILRRYQVTKMVLSDAGLRPAAGSPSQSASWAIVHSQKGSVGPQVK